LRLTHPEPHLLFAPIKPVICQIRLFSPLTRRWTWVSELYPSLIALSIIFVLLISIEQFLKIKSVELGWSWDSVAFGRRPQRLLTREEHSLSDSYSLSLSVAADFSARQIIECCWLLFLLLNCYFFKLKLANYGWRGIC
jgi:hypothetical protein